MAPPTPSEAAATPGMLEGAKAAIEYVETAFKNRHPAATVASSIRTSFPRAFVDQLVSLGTDKILGEVERMLPDSLLASPGGRRFVIDLVEQLRSTQSIG